MQYFNFDLISGSCDQKSRNLIRYNFADTCVVSNSIKLQIHWVQNKSVITMQYFQRFFFKLFTDPVHHNDQHIVVVVDTFI